MKKMENKEFAKQLEARTRRFTIAVIRLSSELPGSPESLVIRNQLTKSGTSIGANYREANRARSRADFINRIKICESEASETQYWLTVISDIAWVLPEEMQTICNECSELLAIFTTIGKNK
jgi:four helix bundle protein